LEKCSSTKKHRHLDAQKKQNHTKTQPIWDNLREVCPDWYKRRRLHRVHQIEGKEIGWRNLKRKRGWNRPSLSPTYKEEIATGAEKTIEYKYPKIAHQAARTS